MADKNAEEIKASFTVKGLSGPGSRLHVAGFRGEESLSSLFHFELDLVSNPGSLDIASLVGKEACLYLERPGSTRRIHGILSLLEQGEPQAKHTPLRATLVPSAWRLTNRVDCRIFQRAPILGKGGIIEQVLTKVRVDHEVGAFKGGSAPAKREYCVQYRESDWAFISRLLEDEGFFHYHRHDADGHRLCIGNHHELHPDLEGGAEVDYHPPDSRVPGKEGIFSFRFNQRLRPTAVALEDYAHESPSAPLLSAAKVGTGGLEVYDYPGGFMDKAAGKARAGIRLEELQAATAQGEGASDCARLCPGYAFSITGLKQAVSGDHRYLLTRVLHAAETRQEIDLSASSQPIQYHNAFSCIPSRVNFRPPRVTPKPSIPGLQTARVTADTGEQQTDKHGQVKVRFHWDRQDHGSAGTSCWIRVSQLWTGAGWGAERVPRKGEEVVVSFIEGDPDQPLIIGSVFNGQNRPPYPLPDQMTRTAFRSQTTPGGGGFNELSFEDKKGQEEVYLHAQRNLREEVQRSQSTLVKGSRSLSVYGDRSESVGRDQKTSVARDATCEIKGKADLTVDKELTVTVKEDHSEEVDKARTLKAKTITLQATDGLKLECGGGSIAISKSGVITIKGTTEVVVKGGVIKLN